MKYYYSLFVERNGSGTIFRPVFFEFPMDANLLNMSNPYTDEQFLVGQYLMVAPVLYEGNTWVNAYFPQARWYDFFTGEMIQDSNTSAGTVNISAPLNSTIPLFIRAGGIVHTQNTENVLSSADLDSDFVLIVALSPIDSLGNLSASGKIMSLVNYSDANIITKCQMNNCFLDITANVSNMGSSIVSHVTVVADSPGNVGNLEPVSVNEVHLYGAFEPDLSGAEVYYNGEILQGAMVERAAVGHPVVYLPSTIIKHGDVLKIVKYIQ